MAWRRAQTWLLALLTQAAACKGPHGREAVWLNDAGASTARVRNGELHSIHHERFRSSALDRDVGFVVVTPTAYDEDAERRYPVVYVFPGIGGDEWSYLREHGLESSSIQALFAEPRKAPILVFANPGDSGGHGLALRVLAEELVSQVDQRYRTQPRAQARSLEGFSLGGATALTLLLHRPDVFGRAAALSSACYLIPTCGALRRALTERAGRRPSPPVLLAFGEREIAQNREISLELAPLLGVRPWSLPNVDHDWRAQLSTSVEGSALGRRIADFHLAGFAAIGGE